jgi:hypothetical protein
MRKVIPLKMETASLVDQATYQQNRECQSRANVRDLLRFMVKSTDISSDIDIFCVTVNSGRARKPSAASLHRTALFLSKTLCIALDGPC